MNRLRRDASAERSEQFHLDKIRNAITRKGRLRALMHWLTAAASQAELLDETAQAVADLVYRVREGIALPDPAPGSPDITDLLYPDRRDTAG